MLNTCENCGKYSADKIISDNGDYMTCKFCGYKQSIKRLPLFIITGTSGVGKSATSQGLYKTKSNVIVMESDILWNNAFNDPENDYRKYRELWLRMCKNISQGGKPVVLCGCSLPAQFESCTERRYFSNLYYLAIVCDDNILKKRLEKRNLRDNDYINNSISFNKWLKENADSTKPSMTLLDTSNLTIEEAVNRASAWIDSLWQI
jgi:broad-specificity NMP kinase